MPQLRKSNMTRGKRDAVISYRGHRVTVHAIDGWHCPECGEIEFAGKEGARYAEALETLHLKTNAEEAAELSQRRAAAIEGGGVNAFSRYENGKARPVTTVVNLFRLLDKHPELPDADNNLTT